MIDTKLRNTALLVAGCFFMENLDGTIVTTAIPAMSRSLGTTTAATSLIVTAYLITLAVLIPLSGWATNRYGSRPVFLSAIVIFTAASLGCALSPNLGMLVTMRVLQGMGGAMMVPVGRMSVLSRTEKQDLIRVTAYIIWPGLIAPVIAPLAGGLISQYASWHWMFLINVPVGIVAFFVALRLIEPLPAEEVRPLDLPGVLLTCTGLGGLTWGAHLVAEDTAHSGGGVVWCLASVVLLAIAIWHLLRVPSPLLNLRTLRVHTFRAAVEGFFVFALVVWSLPFLLPLLFQNVFGWSPVQSGWAVIWIFVGNIGIKPATTWLLNRFGFRNNLLVSNLGVALSIALFALTSGTTPFWVIAIIALVSGVFRSVGFTAYNTIAFSDVPLGGPMREANALYATMQQLAGGLGILVTMLALRAGELWSGALTVSPLRAQYAIAILIEAGVALVPGLLSLRLHPDAGEALRSRQ